MTTPTERLEPGYYLCVPNDRTWPFTCQFHDNGNWYIENGDFGDYRIEDPRTLTGYTIHYLPDLMRASSEAERLRGILKRMPDCVLLFRARKDRDAWDQWRSEAFTADGEVIATPQGEEGEG